MIDIIAQVILLVFLGFCGFLFIREVLRESKRSKIQFEKHQEFETQVVHHLGNIASRFSGMSYISELRMDNTCYHCRFKEVCQQDAMTEGAEFDYLLCEEFQKEI